MKRLWACLLLLLLPMVAWADGKMFRSVTAVAADVSIPDQRALIHFTNGVERLVIETRFTGSGTNFAWVVPLPNQPVVEAATTGLFPTLQYLFQPRITHNVTRYYRGVLIAIGVGYLLLFVTPQRNLNIMDLVFCLLVSVGAGTNVPMLGVIIFILLIIPVLWIRLLKRPPASVLLVGTTIILLFMVLLPSLVRSRATAGMNSLSSESVSILDRKLVGVFETATISSHDPQALQTWLHDNGFAVPTNSEPVIARYVKDGWVFVATKVRRDKPDSETSTPHPLSFTFKTDKPVYPMRLTGVDNGPLRVELYVFGPSRAKAPHFKVVRCSRPNYAESPVHWSRWSPGTLDIVHPLLRRWVDGSPVATKLTAILSPADMREDVRIEWTSFSEKRNALFSPQGALTLALNVGLIVIGIGVFVTGVITFIAVGCDWPPRWVWKLTSGSLLLGLFLIGGVYFILPKTEVRLMRNPAATSQNALSYLYEWLYDTKEVTAAEIRAEAAHALSNPTNDVQWVNYAPAVLKEPRNNLVGAWIHEEDSPGNYMLSETNGLLLFIAYDAQGAGHVLGNWNLQTNH